MVGLKKAVLSVGAFAVISLAATVASAGLLGTGRAYNDGTRTWEGSQTFSKSNSTGTLSGWVEYAVFRASDFAEVFQGYAPVSGDLVYAYQVFNTGSLNITLARVALLNSAPAELAGSFTGHGVAGQGPNLSFVTTGQNVTWDFGSGHNIVHPGNSLGLAFSSERTPISRDVAVIVDGALSTNVPNLAGPGTLNIPEPSCLAMLVAGAVAAVIGVARNRRKS